MLAVKPPPMLFPNVLPSGKHRNYKYICRIFSPVPMCTHRLLLHRVAQRRFVLTILHGSSIFPIVSSTCRRNHAFCVCDYVRCHHFALDQLLVLNHLLCNFHCHYDSHCNYWKSVMIALLVRRATLPINGFRWGIKENFH